MNQLSNEDGCLLALAGNIEGDECTIAQENDPDDGEPNIEDNEGGPGVGGWASSSVCRGTRRFGGIYSSCEADIDQGDKRCEIDLISSDNVAQEAGIQDYTLNDDPFAGMEGMCQGSWPGSENHAPQVTTFQPGGIQYMICSAL